MKQKVEMRPAWEWTCENCGRNNFETCLIREMTREDYINMKIDFGLKDIPEGACPDIVGFYEEVKCPHCGEEFETKNMDDM